MPWREKLRNPFVQQYLIEILFPLVGYFFFDWSLTVIAVFYLIDQLASETSFIRRLNKISKNDFPENRKLIFVSVGLFVLLFSVEVFFLHDSFQSIREISDQELNAEIFLFAKDELWLLFPLVILLYHFKDQFTFYMPRRYLQYNPKKTFAFHQIGSMILILLVIAGISAWRFITMPDVVVLIIFLVLKLCYDFSIAKWVDKKSKS